jgi:hypothetical protein
MIQTKKTSSPEEVNPATKPTAASPSPHCGSITRRQCHCMDVMEQSSRRSYIERRSINTHCFNVDSVQSQPEGPIVSCCLFPSHVPQLDCTCNRRTSLNRTNPTMKSLAKPWSCNADLCARAPTIGSSAAVRGVEPRFWDVLRSML